MIDFHAHVLPMIDDGAKSVSESIVMLTDSKKQGVEVCVATPHVTVHRESSVSQFIEKRNKSIELLENQIKTINDELPKLLYGAEVFLDNDISLYPDIDKLCISGSKCMLIELLTGAFNPRIVEWLYSLNHMGIFPILAHVERYPYFEEMKNELSEINVAYQMNSKTVLSFSGKKLLYRLYEANDTVMVSGDMHNMGQRRSYMKKAYEKVNKRYPDMAERIFKLYAQKLLNIE